jgi:hypothetical protein
VILAAIALVGGACTGGADGGTVGGAGSTSGAAAGGPVDLKSGVLRVHVHPHR